MPQEIWTNIRRNALRLLRPTKTIFPGGVPPFVGKCGFVPLRVANRFVAVGDVRDAEARTAQGNMTIALTVSACYCAAIEH